MCVVRDLSGHVATGVIVDANVFLTARFGAAADVKAIAYCVTPGGKVFAASGNTVADAITAMQSAPVFNDTLDVAVQRHVVGNTTPLGLGRHVKVASGASPWIQSIP